MAQSKSDSLSVIVAFPCGSDNISKISGNILSLDRFTNQLDSLCRLPYVTPLRILVVSSTSPEGSIGLNTALASRRNHSLSDYLNQHSETFRSISTSLECERVEQITNHLLGKTEKSAYPSLRFSKMSLFYRTLDKDAILAAAPDIKAQVLFCPPGN